MIHKIIQGLREINAISKIVDCLNRFLKTSIYLAFTISSVILDKLSYFFPPSWEKESYGREWRTQTRNINK